MTVISVVIVVALLYCNHSSLEPILCVTPCLVGGRRRVGRLRTMRAIHHRHAMVSCRIVIILLLNVSLPVLFDCCVCVMTVIVVLVVIVAVFVIVVNPSLSLGESILTIKT